MKSDKYWQRALTLVDGCTPVSEGCVHCWSKATNDRFKKGDFSNVRAREDRLDIPLRTKKPTIWSIWSDLYHSKVDDSFRIIAYGVMERANQHTYLILTKRAKELREYFQDRLEYRDHIWHGITAENQQRADERIPYLLQVPGKRFLSLEPLLTQVSLEGLSNAINAVIVGCETGPKARPCRILWIESIVQQCKDAGVPCFVKAINYNGRITKEMNEWPKCLRVRQLPWELKG